MPELPEVEVSRQGIAPHIEGQTVKKVICHNKSMRWPVPDDIHKAEGLTVLAVKRRAKYLFIETQAGSLVLHLGMTGFLRVLPQNTALKKHDHVEVQLSNGMVLRFNDARRFGACLWQDADDEPLSILANLGPEPLTDDFDGGRLYEMSRKRSGAVKNFIMDNKVVVGVGNIYANESLFLSGVDPRKAAGKVSRKAYNELCDNIKKVLASAIEQGGTTLKDFSQVDGSPGYFALKLQVYGRTGKPCLVCETDIKSINIGQRNSFYCPTCQR